MLIAILAGVSVIFFLWFIYENRNENQPPGPWKMPGIGNMLQIIKAHPTHSHVAFHKLSKIYGPIMSLKLGWRQVVLLTSYEDMKELLPRDEFSGRVNDSYLLDRAFGKELGVFFTNGKTWDVMRKFTVRTLRDYGFGKFAQMESFLTTEVSFLMRDLDQKIKENNGKISMEGFFPLSILNTIWSMVLGKRYSLDDKKLQDLISLNEKGFLAGSFGASLSFSFPPLRNVPVIKEIFGHHIMLKLFDELHEYMRETLKERKSAEDYKYEAKNFVDRYLCEMDKDSTTTRENIFTEEQFIVTCMDLFQAGTETTSSTLNYAILWLSIRPDVQKKVQEEIDRVVEHGRKPTLEDERLLHYTRATIQEVQRISTVVPLVPPRKIMKDCNYKGHHFKKDTAVMVNLYSVMMDEDYWRDPTSFRPERFLGSDGKYKHDERLTFFGFGKRICLGEVQAKSTIFLFFVSLLQSFEFEVIPGEPKPTTFPAVGLALRPKPYELLVRRRKESRWE